MLGMDAPTPPLGSLWNPKDEELQIFVEGLFVVYQIYVDAPCLTGFPSVPLNLDKCSLVHEYKKMQEHLLPWIAGLDSEKGNWIRCFMQRDYDEDGGFSYPAVGRMGTKGNDHTEGCTYRDLRDFCKENEYPINMFFLVKLMKKNLNKAEKVYSFIRLIGSANLCRETSDSTTAFIFHQDEKDFLNSVLVFAFLGGDAPRDTNPELRGSFEIEETDDSRLAWRLVLTALGLVNKNPIPVYLSHTRDLAASERRAERASMYRSGPS